ncbi:hypothetical protein SSCG_05518 [Streptomyces clavuligerus]|nr:hypothetical protein SSCG_05518 [Streptomyces clavuligerus]
MDSRPLPLPRPCAGVGAGPAASGPSGRVAAESGEHTPVCWAGRPPWPCGE